MIANQARAAAHAKPAADLELGKFGDGYSASDAEGEGGGILSIIVYGLSLFSLVPSVIFFLAPPSNSPMLGHAMGAAGLVIGVYMVLFSDQLMTYLRLWRQLHYLQYNNKMMASVLGKQKQVVKHLQESEHALNSADKLPTEDGETIWDRVSHCMGTVMRGTKDCTRRIIEAHLLFLERMDHIQGQETIDYLTDVFCDMFGRIIQDARQRFGEMDRGIKLSRQWQEHSDLSTDLFAIIVEIVLFTENPAEIADKVEAVCGAQLTADGKLANAVDFSVSEARAVAQELRAADSWASAEAFAFGTGGQ